MATSTLCSFWQKVVVINLFCILLSRSAAGNMPVGGLKPHVLGELGLGICFNLSIFDILNLKEDAASAATDWAIEHACGLHLKNANSIVQLATWFAEDLDFVWFCRLMSFVLCKWEQREGEHQNIHRVLFVVFFPNSEDRLVDPVAPPWRHG